LVHGPIRSKATALPQELTRAVSTYSIGTRLIVAGTGRLTPVGRALLLSSVRMSVLMRRTTGD
jgi:hypothetical protein